MNMVVNFFKSKMDKVIIRPGFRLPLMGDVSVTQKKQIYKFTTTKITNRPVNTLQLATIFLSRKKFSVTS